MTRRAIFTHNDLDGLVSALLGRVAMPDADVYFCDYAGLADLVRDRLDRYDVIWLTDLSIRDDDFFAALRAADLETYWFDHHASSTPQPWMDVCDIDVSGGMSASDVVRRYLEAQGVTIPVPLQTLCDYSHDQDLWIRELEDAQAFNDILGQMHVQELFDLLSADLGRVYHWTAGMTAAAARTREAREASWRLAEQTSVVADSPQGYRVRAACCWGSVSEVGDLIGAPDTLVVLFDLRALERGVAKYSFRTQSAGIDASALAEHLGGGGHPQASGAPLEVEVLRELSQAVLNRVLAAAAEKDGQPCG